MDRSQSNKAQNTAKQMDKPKTAKWSMNFWRDAARKKPQKGTHDPSGGEATADGGARGDLKEALPTALHQDLWKSW